MPESEGPTDSTLSLLTRARNGDGQALEDLLARYLPVLSRWATGRLPIPARDLVDTADLVQETLIGTFKRLDGFEHRGEGALYAYLRQAVLNRIRDELRKARRRPERMDLDEGQPDDGLSPLEKAIGREAVERYEAALQRLSEGERDLIVARLELGLTYGEMADVLGKNSPDAARMAVGRALTRLAEELGEPQSQAD
jgi:RNA polymerase sigma-70 factor (ECF subfamily)